MTTKCANPGCSSPFLYFRSGKIYLIDLAGSSGRSPQPGRGLEYFWLCGDCAQTMHVTLDSQGVVVVERVPEAPTLTPIPHPPAPTKKSLTTAA